MLKLKLDFVMIHQIGVNFRRLKYKQDNIGRLIICNIQHYFQQMLSQLEILSFSQTSKYLLEVHDFAI